MTVRALKYWGIKRGSEMAASTDGVGVHNQFIDKAEFDKKYSFDGKLKFDPHHEGKMSLDYARSLQNDALDDALNRSKSGLSQAPIAGFFGQMAGGLASPLDLALGVIAPEIQAVRWGMGGATAASRAGSGIGVARAASRVANGSVNGLANAIAFQPSMVALSSANQTPYTFEDALNNIALGPIIGAGAGALHASFKQVRGEADRSLANAAMHAAMSDRDPSVVRATMQNDPRIKQAVGFRERVRSLFTQEQRTPEQQAEIKFMAGEPLPEKMTTVQAFSHPSRNNEPGPTTKRLTAERIAREGGDPIDSTTHAPQPQPRELTLRTAKVLDEVLANPEDKRIGRALSDDEKFLADAWQRLFGVELKFIDQSFARDLGILGFTKPSDPGIAYIARGELSGKPSSMMFIAAHELGHQIRFRDTALWSDITGSMMKTAEMKNGPLAEAWRTYVRHANDTGVHAGQDLASKMDETFSHVLGHAMQQQDFWQTMSGTKGAGKLAAALSRIHTRLSELLNHRMTPMAKALYEDLSMALVKAKEAGITLDPKGTDRGLNALYEQHKPGFRQFMRNMAGQMNTEGSAREKALAAHIEWEEQTFPQVSLFSDESTARFTTILKNRRIDSNNPGSWLLQNIFARAKPGTAERNAATMFVEGVRMNGKDPQTSALNKGPLATFKQNADGTWDIGIHRNDNYPHWSEILPDGLSERELVSDTALREHINVMEAEFTKFVEETQGKDAGDMNREFSDYIRSLTDDEIAHAVYNDPTTLWNGYAEHLNYQISQAVVGENGPSVDMLVAHREAIQPLTGAGDGKFNPEHTSPEAVTKAWDKFRKDYPDIQKKLTERKLEMTGNVQGPLAHDITAVPDRKFFETEFKAARAEVLAQLMEHEESRLSIENFLKGTDEKPTKMSDKINAAIDEAARDRLRSVWPQYDKVMQIESALKAEKASELVLDMRDPATLPKEVADSMERFNTGLSDGLDAFDFKFMADESPSPEQVIARKKISKAEGEQLARTRLDREHVELSKYLHTYETAIEPRIKELLERNGMDSFSLDPLPKRAAGATPVEKPTGPLADALEGVKNTYNFGMKQLGNIRAGRMVDTANPTGRRVAAIFDYHARQGLDMDGAVKASAQDLRREAQSRVVATLRNDESHKGLVSRARASLDTLYSYLDGISRKNVQGAGASVAEAMGRRIVNDTTPFTDGLVSHGLEHVWLDSSHAQHAVLVRSVIEELKFGGGKDPIIKSLAETLRKTHEVQVGRMNANGANIRPLPGYVFSQLHNPHAIGRNKTGFIKDLWSWLDWEATGKAVGFDHNDLNARQTYLEQAHYEMSKTERTRPLDFNPETMGGNIANQESHRRTFYFNGTSAFDYDIKYGSGNTAGLIMGQIMKRAELTTIMEHFGADYKKVWSGVMADLGKVPAFGGQGLISRALSKVDQLTSKLGRIGITFDRLTGDMNNPDNHKLAEWASVANDATDSAVLWMTGISSVSDVGNMAGVARWAGVDTTNLHGRLIASMIEQAQQSPQQRRFLMAQGAGLSSMLAAMTRAAPMDHPVARFFRGFNDMRFKWSGQEIVTNSGQAALHDLLTQHLGDMSKLKVLPEEFANWLRHYGITDADWKVMASHATDIDGLAGTRLAPDLITNPSLAEKLGVALGDSAHQGVLEPSISDKGLATLGVKDGTPAGVAIRMMTRYKPYALAMLRRVHRRFAYGYGNEGLYSMGSTAQMHALVWSASMLSIAATILSIKDVLRGREPLNPFDTEQWTIKNVARIVSTAGVGPLAVAEQFMSVNRFMGPLPGAVINLAQGIATGSGYRTTNAVIGMLPGSSIIPLREGAKAIIGEIFPDTYGVNFQLFLQRNEAESGQSSILQK
jgi:hypothetical protein